MGASASKPEAMTSEERDRLSWRDDPVLSYSDCTIQVVVLPEKNKQTLQLLGSSTASSTGTTTLTFHVHKCIVAVGKRKSQWLYDLLGPNTVIKEINSITFSPSSNTITMELPASAAAAFPIVLDYLYNPNQPLPPIQDMDMACALDGIAHALNIPQLVMDVEALFWKNSHVLYPNIDTVATCYQHAVKVRNDRLRRVVVDWCRKNLVSLKAPSPLVQESDSQLWLDILRTTDTSIDATAASATSSTSISRHMSTLIAAHCRHKVDSMNAKTFHTLTDPQYLPLLDLEAAMQLSNLEDQIVGRAISESNLLSNLQERCVATIYKDWKPSEQAPNALEAFLNGKDKSFVLAFYLQILEEKARTDGNTTKEETKSSSIGVFDFDK